MITVIEFIFILHNLLYAKTKLDHHPDRERIISAHF